MWKEQGRRRGEAQALLSFLLIPAPNLAACPVQPLRPTLLLGRVEPRGCGLSLCSEWCLAPAPARCLAWLQPCPVSPWVQGCDPGPCSGRARVGGGKAGGCPRESGFSRRRCTAEVASRPPDLQAQGRGAGPALLCGGRWSPHAGVGLSAAVVSTAGGAEVEAPPARGDHAPSTALHKAGTTAPSAQGRQDQAAPPGGRGCPHCPQPCLPWSVPMWGWPQADRP